MDPLNVSKTLAEQSYQSLLDAICDGSLVPGERLTQDDVAKRLNVSRQPVANAFAMLRAQGFVREAGRRGVMVAPIDEELFRTIYEFRSALEPLAAELAARRMTPEHTARGRDILVRGQRLAATRDTGALLAAELDFHSLIYEVSGNRLIGDSMRLNWHHLRRAMSEVLRLPDFSSRVWREHAAIFEAMVQGDAAGAAKLMRDHVVDAQQHAAAHLKR